MNIHYDTLKEEYLDKDYYVILDRYTPSNLAHQGSKIIDKDEFTDGAYNVRGNGKGLIRKTTESNKIEQIPRQQERSDSHGNDQKLQAAASRR